MGETAQPWNLEGLRRVRRWQRGHADHYAVDYATLGVLPDGRWVAEHSDTSIGTTVYGSREDAETRLTEWMWHGIWQEIPAAYGPDGKPIGEGWTRRGSRWVREG